MDAKSLLLRALVMRVARRAVFAAVMAWAAFGWISGRFDVVGGTQHMFAYLGGKLSKDRLAAGVEPFRFSQDAAPQGCQRRQGCRADPRFGQNSTRFRVRLCG